jgi:hypothetical protein
LFPVLVAALSSASLLDARQDWMVCGTHALSGQEAIALHRAAAVQGTPSSIRMRAAGTQSVARDIGNIAVMEDADGVVARRNPFNLDTRTLRFLPQAGSSAYRFETAANSYDLAQASAGTTLTGLDDDDARQVPCRSRSVLRPGVQLRIRQLRRQPHVHLADTSTAARSLGRMNAGPPRIAALFRDLDPSRDEASVRVLSTSNVFAVSWVNVPEYASSNNGPRQTFQLRLFPDGRIETAFSSIPPPRRSPVSHQEACKASAPSSAFARRRRTYSGTLAERFSGAEVIDVVFSAQKFYETHEDAYDYLVLYNNLGIPADEGAVAYEVTLRNAREGYGDLPIEAGASYGSRRRLQGFLNLGPLSQYPRDPLGIVPARATSRDTPLSVLGHEAGHLFLAFVSVRDPADPTSLPMLGRQSAHWNFRFNSEASLLEGNRIRDDGPSASPRFTTTATVEGYSPLDQYLMGFRGASEVPSTFYVSGASIGSNDRPPQSSVSFNGNRRDVSVDDIVALYGPRRPGPSMSQRRYRFGFILITAAGQEPSAADLAKLDEYRQRFSPIIRGTIRGGRSLRRAVQFSMWPALGIVAGSPRALPSRSTNPPRCDNFNLNRWRPRANSASVTVPAGAAGVTSIGRYFSRHRRGHGAPDDPAFATGSPASKSRPPPLRWACASSPAINSGPPGMPCCRRPSSLKSSIPTLCPTPAIA